MPKRKPVKPKDEAPVETAATEEEKEEEKVVEVDPPKPKRKRKRKSKKATSIKLEVTEDVTKRFEVLFSWYRSEKKATVTPNGFALEVFELGLKVAEEWMEVEEKEEEGISWDRLPEMFKTKDKVDEAKVDEVATVDGVDTVDAVGVAEVDIDAEPGYDPDFEEAFQNHCLGNV